MAFNWEKVIEWNKFEDDFDHNSEELQVIVTAKSAMYQIWKYKKYDPITEKHYDWGFRVII